MPPPALEAAAAACTLLANAVLLRRLCTDATGPVPLTTLTLQLTGNAMWISHSGLAGDRWLLASSLASFGLQAAALSMRAFGGRSPRASLRRIRDDVDSLESLPRLPPVPG